MKRTNLVLDEHLLNEAIRIFGTKTYSEAVNRALAESVRMAEIAGMEEFFGTGIWSGSLEEMRGDSPLSNKPHARKKTRKRK